MRGNELIVTSSSLNRRRQQKGVAGTYSIVIRKTFYISKMYLDLCRQLHSAFQI